MFHLPSPWDIPVNFICCIVFLGVCLLIAQVACHAYFRAKRNRRYRREHRYRGV